MIPQDGAILYSFLNMKLRDGYDSLASLCEDLELDEEELLKTLRGFGYHYDEKTNQIR